MTRRRRTAWARALRGRRVPLWLKVAFTAMVLVIVPFYWDYYGPKNFLWFSDVALFAIAIALWIESPLLAGMMLVGTLLPELAWQLDFWVRLLTPWGVLDIAAYMFDPEYPLYIRILSLFHIPLLLAMCWLVWRLGYDRGSFPAMAVLGWAVLVATYLLTEPADNINWVFGPSDQPQDRIPQGLYFAIVMLAFPVFVWLPTHLLLRWLVRPSGRCSAK